MSKLKNYTYIIDDDYKIVYFNDILQQLRPELQNGVLCYEALGGRDKPCTKCPIKSSNSDNETYYNQHLRCWVNISHSSIDWPGAGPCHLLVTSPTEETTRNLFFNLTHQSAYDELLELNLADDSYELLYQLPGKYITPAKEGCYSEMAVAFCEYAIHPDDSNIFLNLFDIQRLSNKMKSFSQEPLMEEFRQKTTYGDWRWVQALVIPSPQDENTILCFISDIHERMLQHDSSLQPASSGVLLHTLTRLYNRPVFFQKSEEYMQSHPAKKLCMTAIDIEHFKLFNRWYGRSIGDKFLQEISSVLRHFVRVNGGVAGYFSDDDFAILMPDDDELLSELYDELAGCVKHYRSSIGFLPVLGAYSIEDRSMPAYTIYDQALLALSFPADNHSSKIHRYDASITKKIEAEQILLAQVHQALLKDEFIFYAQPHYHINTGKIVGAEALIRWQHKTKGLIPPGEFIPFLEERGLITEVDCRLWDKVCRALSEWIRRGFRPIPISVNVSRMDFYAIDVAEHFNRLVKKYNLNPALLEIEITESAYAEDNRFIADVIEQLKSYGFTVLIDDFGSGYSSLNMLKNVNADILKIDTKFLDIDTQHLKKGEGIIEAIINMARLMSMSIICEGVETKQQYDFLCSVGCRYAQGFYFCRPLPVSEFEALLLRKDTVDFGGISPFRGEALHIAELLNKSLFSEMMVNNILGPVALFNVKDNNIHLARANAQFYRLIGNQDSSVVLPEQFIDNIYKNDHPIVMNMFKQALENRHDGASSHIRYITWDGRCIWISMNLFFLKEQDKQQIFYASFSDVTEFYQQKWQLESSQKALSSIVYTPENDKYMLRLAEENRKAATAIYAQMNPCGMMGGYCEPDFPLYFANAEMIKLLRYDSYEDFAEDINGLVINSIHPADREHVCADVGNSYLLGQEYTSTYRMKRKDGSFFWVFDKGRVVLAENGRLAIVSACTDISEIMYTQEKLSERNSRLLKQNQEFQHLNNEMPGGYHRCANTPDYDFIYLSDRFLEIFGYTHKEIKELFDNKFMNMVHPDDRHLISAEVNHLLEHKANHNIKYRMHAKHGYIWVIDESRLITYDKHEFFQGIIIDVSELMELKNRINLLSKYTTSTILLFQAEGSKTSLETLSESLVRDAGLSSHEWEMLQQTLLRGIQAVLGERKNFHRLLAVENMRSHTLWVDLEAYCIEDTPSNISYICAVRDVTSEQTKHQELLLTNQKLVSTLRLAGVNSWDWDLITDTMTLINASSDESLQQVSRCFSVPIFTMTDFSNQGPKARGIIIPGYENLLLRHIENARAPRPLYPQIYEIPIQTPAHHVIWLRISYEVIKNDDGFPVRVIGAYTNITAQKILEQKNQENTMLSDLIRSQSVYNFRANLSQDIIYNENSDDIILGATYGCLTADLAKCMVLPEYQTDFLHFVSRTRLLQLFDEDTIIEHMDLQWQENSHPEWARVTVYLTRFADTSDIYIYFFVTNIDEEKREELHLSKMAKIDALTGVYNRNWAIPHMKSYLKKLQNHNAALIMFDMDNFKMVNDVFGHTYGDTVITTVAQKIKSSFRINDVICRVGGDEFLVLCKNINQENVNRKIAEVVRSLLISYNHRGQKCYLSVSAGYVMIPEQGKDFDDLFKKADTAMFHAKMNGKNSYCQYHPDMKTVRFELADSDSRP